MKISFFFHFLEQIGKSKLEVIIRRIESLFDFMYHFIYRNEH